MGLFSITRDVVLKLLGLIDSGLLNTAGSMEDNTFCVQQAVSLATGMPSKDDQPKHCVMPWIINLGIRLNDSNAWEDEKSRAAGLREFAVAELGSAHLRESSFRELLRKKVNAKWPAANISPEESPEYYVEAAEQFGEVDGIDDSEEGLKQLVKMVVEVLQELSCQGTEYLFMANKTEYERPEQFKGVRIPQIKPATEIVKAEAWIAEDAPWEDPKPVK